MLTGTTSCTAPCKTRGTGGARVARPDASEVWRCHQQARRGAVRFERLPKEEAVRFGKLTRHVGARHMRLAFLVGLIVCFPAVISTTTAHAAVSVTG